MPNRRPLLLAIDVGNSTATYAVFSGKQIKHSSYIRSYSIPQYIKKTIKSGGNSASYSVIISSVVPYLTRKLAKTIKQVSPRAPLYIMGQNLRLKSPMKYRSKALGADRLANIYGALKRYKPPILVIDYGTAITFDYISKKGIFEGGLIIPGLELSARALEEHTALLPKLGAIKPTRGLFGRNTKEAMNAGLFNGFAALSDGLIERFRKLCRPAKLTVVATGGIAAKIAPYVQYFDYVDPMHTIRSLALIYENEIQKTHVR